MGRTATKRKPEAPSDTDGDSQQRVTTFFSASKLRQKNASAEEPMRSIETPNTYQRRRAVDQDWRVARCDIENQVSIRTQNSNFPQRPLSRLMAERISSAMKQSELAPEKLQQTCIVVCPLKRQSDCDVVTL